VSDEGKPIDIQVTTKELRYIVSALHYMRSRVIDSHHEALRVGKEMSARMEHKRELEILEIEKRLYEEWKQHDLSRRW
jgi:hypothetical protein